MDIWTFIRIEITILYSARILEDIQVDSSEEDEERLVQSMNI